MNKKPSYFSWLSLFLLGVVISFPAQILYLFEYELSDIYLCFSQLSLINWLVMASCLIASIFIWRVYKYVNYVAVGLVLLVSVNNLAVGLTEVNYTLMESMISEVIFVIPLMFLFNPSYQKLIYNPALHYWKTPRRFSLQEAVYIDKELNIISESVNVSSSGILIRISNNELTKMNLIERFKNPVLIRFTVKGHQFSTLAKKIRSHYDFKSNEYFMAFHYCQLSLLEQKILQFKLASNSY